MASAGLYEMIEHFRVLFFHFLICFYLLRNQIVETEIITFLYVYVYVRIM